MNRVLIVSTVVASLVSAGSAAAWGLGDDSRREAALTIATERTSTFRRVEEGSRLTSPEGKYEVSVTDSGIRWRGPGGSIELTPAGIKLDGAASVSLRGAALVKVEGAQVRLCAAGGVPVARVGDLVNASVAPPHLVAPIPGPIIQGSPTVTAC